MPIGKFLNWFALGSFLKLKVSDRIVLGAYKSRAQNSWIDHTLNPSYIYIHIGITSLQHNT